MGGRRRRLWGIELSRLWPLPLWTLGGRRKEGKKESRGWDF
jgi:hypothetical protein